MNPITDKERLDWLEHNASLFGIKPAVIAIDEEDNKLFEYVDIRKMIDNRMQND